MRARKFLKEIQRHWIDYCSTLAASAHSCQVINIIWSFLIEHLCFLFWKFWHIRNQYNQSTEHLTNLVLHFWLEWCSFCELWWVGLGFTFDCRDWLNFQIFWHKVLFFNENIRNMKNNIICAKAAQSFLNKGCFTLWHCHLHQKKILRQKKKNNGNSNISPCKILIFKKTL